MAIKAGNVRLTGSTASVMDRSLIALRSLIDRSLADVRVTAGMSARHELISLAAFISEVRMPASLEARSRGCKFTVSEVDSRLAVNVDREMLLSALANLLQNTFKFTKEHTEVTLNAYAATDRIRIDVEDHCGGLPAGASETMFRPFAQSGEDKSGVGLGLSICQRSVEANSGTLSDRNVTGSGCVITINLSRHSLKPD